MSETFDYYEALGVAKTATDEEIKKAHKSIIMRNHPDKRAKMTDAEKAESAKKYDQAQEAFKVLGDATKRLAFDKYGVAGLSAMANVSTSAPTTHVRREAPDPFDYFSRGEEKPEARASAPQPSAPAEDHQPRRAGDARKARLAAVAAAAGQPLQPTQTSSADARKTASLAAVFNDVREVANEATALLRDPANTDLLPKEALANMRRSIDTLSAMLKNKGF